MLSCPVINFSIPYTYRVLQVVVFIQFRIWWFQKEFDLNILNISNVSYKCVVPGGAVVAMALPEFGRSVNPISRFSYLRLPTALKSCRKTVDENMSYFYYWYIRLFRLKNFMNPQIKGASELNQKKDGMESSSHPPNLLENKHLKIKLL